MGISSTLLVLFSVFGLIHQAHADSESVRWIYESFDTDRVTFESVRGKGISVSTLDVTQLAVNCTIPAEFCIDSDTFTGYLPFGYRDLDKWELNGTQFVYGGELSKIGVLGMTIGPLHRVYVKKPRLSDTTRYRYFSFLYSEEIGLVAFKETNANYISGTYLTLVGSRGLKTGLGD